jgi:hypothetical protein
VCKSIMAALAARSVYTNQPTLRVKKTILIRSVAMFADG